MSSTSSLGFRQPPSHLMVGVAAGIAAEIAADPNAVPPSILEKAKIWSPPSAAGIHIMGHDARAAGWRHERLPGLRDVVGELHPVFDRMIGIARHHEKAVTPEREEALRSPASTSDLWQAAIYRWPCWFGVDADLGRVYRDEDGRNGGSGKSIERRTITGLPLTGTAPGDGRPIVIDKTDFTQIAADFAAHLKTVDHADEGTAAENDALAEGASAGKVSEAVTPSAGADEHYAALAAGDVDIDTGETTAIQSATSSTDAETLIAEEGDAGEPMGSAVHSHDASSGHGAGEHDAARQMMDDAGNDGGIFRDFPAAPRQPGEFTLPLCDLVIGRTSEGGNYDFDSGAGESLFHAVLTPQNIAPIVVMMTGDAWHVIDGWARVEAFRAQFGNTTNIQVRVEQANTGLVGHEMAKPVSTITSAGSHQRLVETTLIEADALPPEQLARAVKVAAFLVKYYGNEDSGHGLDAPIGTVTTKDRFAVVTVTIDAVTYVVVDIGMRMLTRRELANAQGFPADYILDPIGPGGKPLTISSSIRMIGNSVCPDMAEALARANVAVEQFERVAA